MSSPENPSASAMIITDTMISSTATTNSTGSQRGDVTHHQDQSIRLVSLRVKKIKNSTIVVLTPDVVLDDDMFD